jgi:hypothetical protein
MGYALQWFGFALVGLVGWLALMLRNRAPPRIVVPPAIAAIILLGGAAPVNAQLRPLDPMEWSIFDDDVRVAASVGTSILWDQAATLAGTRGRLHEVGNYTAAFRSGRFAMSLGGTALLRYHDRERYAEPIGAARAPNGSVREDAGRAIAATLVRLSEHHWPVDLVVRFGSVIPTTSDDAGLDRDRTDFFALLGARYQRGDLAVSMENGVGINGTVHADYPQSDVWTYQFGLSWGNPRFRGVAALVGHQDGMRRTVRGNEDQREARIGVDVGRTRSFAIRYVIGLAEHSPRSGISVRGSILLGPRR